MSKSAKQKRAAVIRKKIEDGGNQSVISRTQAEISNKSAEQIEQLPPMAKAYEAAVKDKKITRIIQRVRKETHANQVSRAMVHDIAFGRRTASNRIESALEKEFAAAGYDYFVSGPPAKREQQAATPVIA